MRAQRCYEVAKLAPDRAKILCEGSCQECDYYDEVFGQNTNVLVVTDDPVQESILRAGAREAAFNFEIADCEYRCSALVNQFKPDFVFVDCSLGPQASRDITLHLVQDPRIPLVRVVLAGSENDFPRECERGVFARIERPFTIRDIGDCVEFVGTTG
jgi:DNA-binding response OmpR family regulator